MLKRITTILLASTATIISLFASANIKYFEADIQDSKWEFQGNRLNCQLIHDIPLYGKASFSQSAGHQKQLDFLLSYKRHPLQGERTAQVRAIAPSWQPTQYSKELGEVKLKNGQYIVNSQSIASWQLLYELEAGRFPTFSYQDLNQIDERVSVALSAVRFRDAYDNFLECVSSLIKYDLEQLNKMTLYFDFDKSNVKKAYQEKLNALAAYIKYDPSIEIIFIEGHTDNKGSRSYNQKLAERRISSVKKVLQLDGVNDERFKTHAFGEKKPIASNRYATGRAKNRRVLIRIAQH